MATSSTVSLILPTVATPDRATCLTRALDSVLAQEGVRVVANGSDCDPGRRDQGPGNGERTLSIMDFAPTITKMLGVELPDVDGQPVEELLAGVETEEDTPMGRPQNDP